MILAAVWGIVTVVFIGLLIFRSFITMKEEDTVFLSDGESKMEIEQREIQNRLKRLSPYTRAFGYSSLGLALILAGTLVYRSVIEFMRT